MTVLQGQVSDGQAHPEWFHRASYPQHTGPSPSSSMAEFYGVNNLARHCISLFPPSLWAAPCLTSCFPFPAHLFSFLHFEFANRMNPHQNPSHPSLPLFARTFQFCKPYGYRLLHQHAVTQSQLFLKMNHFKFFISYMDHQGSPSCHSVIIIENAQDPTVGYLMPLRTVHVLISCTKMPDFLCTPNKPRGTSLSL